MFDAFGLIFLALGFFAGAPQEPLSAKELPEFLGPVSADAISWTKYLGPDFIVYYGHARPPISADVAFYLGGATRLEPVPNSETVESTLGIYPVQWRRVVAKDGSVEQTALIRLDDWWKVNIGVKAKSQRDMDQLVAIIARLPTFTTKPKPVWTQ
jgi:hypothetical protein